MKASRRQNVDAEKRRDEPRARLQRAARARARAVGRTRGHGVAVDRGVSPVLKSVNKARRRRERVPTPTRSPLEGDHREDLRESQSHSRSRSWLRRDRTPRTSLSRLASQSCARGARSTASRAKRIFERARARARTLATATRCAARGLSRGGRAPYLGEGAARARRDDVNPMVFGVARERLRGGREAAARSRPVPRGAAGRNSGPRGPNAARYVGQDVGHAPGPAFAAGPPLHPEGAAGPVVARLVLVVVLVRRHGPLRRACAVDGRRPRSFCALRFF